MNGFILTLGLGLLAVLLPAVGVAWWEYRRRAAEVHTRRREADVPRRKPRSPETREPASPVPAVDAELPILEPAAAGVGGTPEAATMAVTARPTPPTATPTQAPVPAHAGGVDAVPAPSPRDRFDGPGWAETAPMTGMGTEPSFAETMPAELHHFAETLPAELDLSAPPAPPGKRRQPA